MKSCDLPIKPQEREDFTNAGRSSMIFGHANLLGWSPPTNPFGHGKTKYLQKVNHQPQNGAFFL